MTICLHVIKNSNKQLNKYINRLMKRYFSVYAGLCLYWLLKLVLYYCGNRSLCYFFLPFNFSGEKQNGLRNSMQRKPTFQYNCDFIRSESWSTRAKSLKIAWSIKYRHNYMQCQKAFGFPSRETVTITMAFIYINC